MLWIIIKSRLELFLTRAHCLLEPWKSQGRGPTIWIEIWLDTGSSWPMRDEFIARTCSLHQIRFCFSNKDESENLKLIIHNCLRTQILKILNKVTWWKFGCLLTPKNFFIGSITCGILREKPRWYLVLYRFRSYNTSLGSI